MPIEEVGPIEILVDVVEGAAGEETMVLPTTLIPTMQLPTTTPTVVLEMAIAIAPTIEATKEVPTAIEDEAVEEATLGVAEGILSASSATSLAITPMHVQLQTDVQYIEVLLE